MDDLCDTRNTLGVGAGERFRDWRIYPHFARNSCCCAGVRPLSEARTIANELLYIKEVIRKASQVVIPASEAKPVPACQGSGESF